MRSKSGTGLCIPTLYLVPGIMDITASPAECLAAERATALAEFARACKSAARAVSLYPRTHPSIRGALDRLTGSAIRLIPESSLTLVAHPDQLLLDGRAPARTDAAVSELAALLHERLIGELTIDRDASGDVWHAFLVLLGTAADDLIAAGGFARAWAATGRNHFSIHEIDYAEVLRERAGSRDAAPSRPHACSMGAFDVSFRGCIQARMRASPAPVPIPGRAARSTARRPGAKTKLTGSP